MQSITINQPSVVTLALAETDTTTIGGTDGKVTATFSGGTSPYTVSIDSGTPVSASSPYVATGLSSGTHTVLVTDANGCKATQSISISQPVTIGDYVWNDANSNSVQDAGETGYANVGLTLVGTNLAGLAVTNHTTTDATGHYLFTEPAGTYTVSVDATNLSAGGPLAGLTASPAGVGAKTSPATTTLAAGTSDLTLDFGYYTSGSGNGGGLQLVTIGDYVWFDLNGNGIQDDGSSAGIAGVGLTLTGTNASGTKVTGHTTTSAAGHYTFIEAPGTYTVTVDTTNFSTGGPLAGSSPTLTGKGTAGTGSKTSPATTTLASGSDLTLDFGYIRPAPTLTCPPDVSVSVVGASISAFSATQGGWGAPAHGGNIGALLANNFATVYGSSGVLIGSSTGFSLKFTSATAVHNYLPAGGTPNALTASAVNPTSSSAGVFGGQVLALQLAVDFANKGITAGTPLGNLVLIDPTSPLYGNTINQILQKANTALAGGAVPAGMTISSLNDLVTSLTASFDGGVESGWASSYLSLTASLIAGTDPSQTGWPTVVSHCGTAITNYTDVWTNNTSGNLVIQRTWTATDSCGTSTPCTQNITFPSCATASHTAFANFNSTPTPQQATTLWLNLHTKLSGQLVNNGDFVRFTGGTLALSGITASWTTAAIPDGIIIATNGVTTPTTTFSTAANLWTTLVPLAYSSSDIFISGGIIPSSTGYTAGSGKQSVLTGKFVSDISGFSSQWFYGLACYRPAFTYATIGTVDAIAQNGVQAGTPVTQQSGLVAGGSGGGGANYTGSYSATDTYAACGDILPPPPVTLACAAQGTGQVGVAYASSVIAGGGTPPYSFTIASGALPAGLSLNASSGAISGTPLANGSFAFSVKATDSTMPFALSATVACGLSIASPAVMVALPTGSYLGCNPAVLPTDASIQSQVVVSDACPTVNVAVTHMDSGTACASNRAFVITITDTCGDTIVTNLAYSWRYDKTPPTIVAPANLTIVTNLPSSPWYCTFADSDWSGPCTGTNWWSWCNQTYLSSGWWNSCNWNSIGTNWCSYVNSWVNNGAGYSYPCNGRNPGCILSNYFGSIYTNGCVQIGCSDGSGYCAKFTSTDAIRSCLANSATAGALNCNATNPAACTGGQFAAKVLALRLNVDYGDCGANIGYASPCRNFILNDSTSPCNGKTVGQILDIANSCLGGSANVPSGCTPTYMCGLVDNLNRGFQGCQLSSWAACHLTSPSPAPSPAQTGSATVSDNCDGNPSLTYSDAIASGTCAGTYVVTRTWTAVDSCGNTSRTNQTITIVPPGTGTSISGMVALDAAADGCINGDPGLAGVTVQLKNSSATVIASTNTDSLGNYAFTNLHSGIYTVVVVPPAHYTQTVDSDKTLDNQTTINLASCQNLSGVNFGYTGASPALALAVTGPASALCGQTVTFTLTVTNTGNTYFTGGLTVTDSLFGGQIFSAAKVGPGQGFVITTNYVIQPTDPVSLVSAIKAIGCPPVGNSVTNTATSTISVTPCITLGCPTATGQVNVAYSSTIPASGGTQPFTNYVITSGSLPTGLVLATNTGAITGTPTVAGTFSFTTQVKDSRGSIGASACSITIVPGCVAGPTSLAAAPRCGSVILTWTSLSGASSYNVKRSAVSGGPYTTIKSALSSSTTTYTDSTVVNGNSYYYVVSAVKSGSETCNSTEASVIPGTPSPWNCQDVGSVAASGGSYCSTSTYTVCGSGADIWGTADEFHYAYQPASGDCSIVARVTSVQGTDPWAKAGVMIRETLNANAAHCSLFITPGNGVAQQCRTSTGGASANVNNTGYAAPYWVKAVRSGNTFTTYCSANGSTWTQVGSQTITMGANVYIGLCTTSHSDGNLCTATFDNVTATP